MGCTNSKQKQRCRHCHNPYSPVNRRSFSMHLRHHPPPPRRREDSYRVVSLTSTALDSTLLEISNQIHDTEINNTAVGNGEVQKNPKEFSMELIEAKTWSNMINQKIPKIVPKTPIVTPPGEPETINTWELMEGLEDQSPLRSPNHIRSLSFDVNFDRPKSKFEENENPIKPMWLQISEDDSSSKSSVLTDFDPEIKSSFTNSIEQLPPENDNGKHGKNKKVVVYFTSLRGVRKTYEDCCHVRLILKSLGVCVDERDVSMHSGFKEELKELLGSEKNGGGGGLPSVVVGGNYIGGAEEIRRMHEEGELEKLLEGCERADDGGGGGGVACEACGDVRFVPCETCSGSCKIYNDDVELLRKKKMESMDFEGVLIVMKMGLFDARFAAASFQQWRKQKFSFFFYVFLGFLGFDF